MFCLSGVDLWASFDREADQARSIRNATADATVEVQRYLTDPPLPWTADPLAYWTDHKNVYPNLYVLAIKFLCMPATSVPSERVFSKCGEIVCKKRNRLKPSTVEKIVFLNKNIWLVQAIAYVIFSPTPHPVLSLYILCILFDIMTQNTSIFICIKKQDRLFSLCIFYSWHNTHWSLFV